MKLGQSYARITKQIKRANLRAQVRLATGALPLAISSRLPSAATTGYQLHTGYPRLQWPWPWPWHGHGHGLGHCHGWPWPIAVDTTMAMALTVGPSAYWLLVLTVHRKVYFNLLSQ